MKALNHKPTKRRNLTRWMESRLERIDSKLAHTSKPDYVCDMSPESIERCRDRGHRLAHDIQYAWAKVNADKIRATLNTTVSP